MDPVIIVPEGINNADIKKAQERLKEGGQYKDLSTVIVCPTRGVIPARVVESWMNLVRPMNNRVYGPIFVAGAEVGAAYETAVELILNAPGLQGFKYMLTIEEDNIPKPFALVDLYKSICQCKTLCGDHYAAVGGLYWTKGEGTGQPMIYGNPKQMLTFQPQVPKPETVQECNGLGMGFTLFRLDMFRGNIERPWFKTVQAEGEGQGTQDLYFFAKARKAGYRVASDNRVRVGHYDYENDRVY